MNFYILLSSNVFFIWIYIKNIPNIHFPLQIWVEQQRQNQEVMNSSHIDSWTLVIVSKLILNAFYSLSLSSLCLHLSSPSCCCSSFIIFPFCRDTPTLFFEWPDDDVFFKKKLLPPPPHFFIIFFFKLELL